MKIKGVPERFVLLVPGNPAYATDAELDRIVETAVDALGGLFATYQDRDAG